MRYRYVALAAALSLLAVPAAQARTIKVGLVLPYSGVNAEYGQQITRAIDLYLKLHKKELGNDKIVLIKRDSKNPGGAVAKRAVQELITRHHVDFLAGFVFSPNAIASAPLATEAKVPMVIMNAATAWITTLSPYIVRTSFTMWQPGYPMGKYAFDTLKCKTAAVGYTDYPPGKDSLVAFKKGFEDAGGKLDEQLQPVGA